MTVTDFKTKGVDQATLVQVGRLGHAWSGGRRDERFSDGQGPDASRMAGAASSIGDRRGVADRRELRGTTARPGRCAGARSHATIWSMTQPRTPSRRRRRKAAASAPPSLLAQLAAAIADRRIRVVDLTQTLSPAFPQIALPPEMGQCWPFRIEEVSAYDARGPGWYWNNFSCGEHTGTHFDAPIHWISGKDLPNNSVDTIPAQHFVAPACVIDCSEQARPTPTTC
jgi:hypothetical protein